MEQQLQQMATELGEGLVRRGERLCCAESCTGGWIGQAATAVAGSSRWFERGFITYSNAAKQEMLGVRPATLETYGAVSTETVREMAAGGLVHARADWTVAVSGVAGPDGGTPDKPVGLVWLAWMNSGSEPEARRFVFGGDREDVRRCAVEEALRGLLSRLDSPA